MFGGTLWIFLVFIASAVTEGEDQTRDELKQEYVQRMDSMREQEGFRSSLLEQTENVDSEKSARIEDQIEGDPRASDIWRNKVKEFLSSRLESKGNPEDEKKKEVEKGEPDEDALNKRRPPMFLSPPAGDVMVGDTIWRDTFDTQTERQGVKVVKTESAEDRKENQEHVKDEKIEKESAGQSVLEEIWGEKTTESEASVVERTTEREPPFHTTLAGFQEYTAAAQSKFPPVTECQSGQDCSSSQVCYLPTNTCKDQLTLSLSQRSSCTKASDCKDGQVCYLATKTCVCDLGYIEQASSCKAHSTITCKTALSNDTKIADGDHWGVHPYCDSWGIHPKDGEKMSYGHYTSGSGRYDDDPMKFTEGSLYSCQSKRSAEMYYSCYCDEYSCTTEPDWNTIALWWGEFKPCHYTAYVYSPLACTSKVA